MRRTKLGDVYYMQVPNGYKIYQFAYEIPKEGEYIRVFKGLYDEVPNKEYIAKLVREEHDYIISFSARKACKIGLAQFIENYQVPEKFPFPDIMVSFRINAYEKKVLCINILGIGDKNAVYEHFYVDSMSKLPKEYCDIKLINAFVPASWIMYLFDVNFDMTKLTLFHPVPPKENTLKKYQEIIDNAIYINKK